MEKRPFSETKKWLAAAQTITEALPFMRRYTGKTIVIKYGGHAMGDAKLAEIFAKDIVLLKQVGAHPVVVHGGGPQIGQMLDRLKIKSDFIDGLRVTDAATVEIVEMVLSGTINKQVVTAINRAGSASGGIASPSAATRKRAVSSSFETVPSVTARARMMAPIVMLRQPSTKAPTTSAVCIPRSRASTIAERRISTTSLLT